MPKILSAVACNLDTDMLAACLPLMEEERVEALEWSFDTLFKVKETPPWFFELLTAFSQEKRLIGHGVFFSLFSGRWLPSQEDWLRQLKQTAATFRFDHVTEHFGFMTGRDFHQGAPLNIPFTPVTLAIGRDRLARIYEACECPVGLENLAFSYSLEEVKRHGDFLDQLLAPLNGFIILDLHNLYCQLHNFNTGYEEIIRLYPLERVREIHISGGSWDEAAGPGRRIRRDTHDDAVPPEVFELLQQTIDRCPNLKYVVLEQLGSGLVSGQSKGHFYNNFLEMKRIVGGKIVSVPVNSFLPVSPIKPGIPIENEDLYKQQQELSSILESAVSYEDAMQQLRRSSLAHSAWQIENWVPVMIGTAVKIAQKWKAGW